MKKKACVKRVQPYLLVLLIITDQIMEEHLKKNSCADDRFFYSWCVMICMEKVPI